MNEDNKNEKEQIYADYFSLKRRKQEFEQQAHGRSVALCWPRNCLLVGQRPGAMLIRWNHLSLSRAPRPRLRLT